MSSFFQLGLVKMHKQWNQLRLNRESLLNRSSLNLQWWGSWIKCQLILLNGTENKMRGLGSLSTIHIKTMSGQLINFLNLWHTMARLLVKNLQPNKLKIKYLIWSNKSLRQIRFSRQLGLVLKVSMVFLFMLVDI